jgi:hypothetical protein
VPQWGGVGDPHEGHYAGLPGKAFAKVLQEIWTGLSPSAAYWNATRVLSDNRLAAIATDSRPITKPSSARGMLEQETLLAEECRC